MSLDSSKSKKQLIEELNQARKKIAELESRAQQEENTELRGSQGDRMMLALEAVNDAVWDLRVNTGEVFYSPSWYTMLGYEPYEFPQEFNSWKNLLHPDDRPEVLDKTFKKIESGDPLKLEYRLRAKDGSWRWIYARGTTVEFDDTGYPQRIIGTHVDITELKNMEEALTLSEERFRNILDDVEMVSIQGYDEHRKVVYWNCASEKLYGFTREEAMGRRLEDLIIPPAMRDEVIAHITNWYENDIPIPAGKLELVRKDGSQIQVYSSHAMQRTHDNKKEMFCIDVDLTEIHKVHRQLIEAKDMAEAANRAKSEFLANMSHEIRTPLNGLLGMLQLLENSPLDKEQTEFTGLAIRSTRRLNQLLGDILDLSRVEAGKLTIRNERFDLPDLLRQIHELFSPTAKQSGLALHLNLPSSLPKNVLGDAARLQQILTNLIGNAFKFTQEGSITIAAQPLKHSAKGERILFTITDTGPGIPTEQINELFTPFTQASRGYRRIHQGAGLGLSICKQLVTLMGGGIAVDTRSGKGTSIFFQLPFGSVDNVECSPPTDETTPDLIGLKALLAEDETISRLSTTKQLQSFGCSVTAVENGQQAVDAFEENDFDFILMDIQMPELDGVEATEQIRNMEKGRRTPIIALTAYAMANDKKIFLAAGMDGYLAKPVERKNLWETIVNHLKLSS